MKDSKLTYQYIFGTVIILLFFTACSESNELSVSEPEVQQVMRIRWDVQQEGMEEGRALVNNDAALRNACSTGGKAIGIWSAYELSNGNLVTHVLGATEDVSLIYDANTAWDNWEGWTYGEKASIWKMGVVYYFNAYFPKTNAITGMSHTKTSITGEYDTTTSQEDLLVEKVVVDTNADTFKGSPIELDMKHALAALRFQFQSKEGVSMKLKSFALQNNITEEDIVQGLGTSGTLTFNGGAEVALSNWVVATPFVATPFYAWQHAGVDFNSTKATAYQKDASSGALYTDNQGYVLIIPQEYNGQTKMIFETDSKSDPFEVTLPAPTEEGTVNKFLPGYRYTYLIKVSNTNVVTLDCKVQPWNLNEENWDFDDQISVSEGGELTWTEGTYQGSISTQNAEVTLAPGVPLVGQFKLDTPTGATWHAEFIPQDATSVGAFVFVKSDGTTSETIAGEVGKPANLTIRSANTSITSNKKAVLRISVKTADGRTMVVRELMPSGFDKNEYTIIQSI